MRKGLKKEWVRCQKLNSIELRQKQESNVTEKNMGELGRGLEELVVLIGRDSYEGQQCQDTLLPYNHYTTSP
jgi:hypothetical protein